MKRFLVCAAMTAVAGSLMTGCSTGRYIADPAAISDQTWVLASINGSAPAGGVARVTMEFSPASAEQGRVTGQGPCNHYFGGYKVEKNGIQFTPMGSTMMACPERLMEAERDYLTALESAKRITLENGQLQLEGGRGALSLNYVQETGLVQGSVNTRIGKFPAGSKMLVRLQELGMKGMPPAVIGMETIPLQESVSGPVPVPFSVRYAPMLVKPSQPYVIDVQILNKGQVIYRSSGKNKVTLHHVPLKLSKKQ